MKSSLLVLIALNFTLAISPTQAIAASDTSPKSAPNQPGIINRPNLKSGSQGADVSELQAVLKLLGYYTGTVNGVYGESTASAVSRFQTEVGLKADGIVGQTTWNRLFPTPVAMPESSSPSADPQVTVSVPPLNRPTTANPKPPTPTAANSPPKATPNPNSNAPKPRKPQSTTVTNPPPATTTARNSKPPASSSKTIELPILKPGMQGSAVTRLQQRLRSLGFFNGSITGFFGSTTETAVKAVQRKFKLNPDGVVGSATWNVLLP